MTRRILLTLGSAFLGAGLFLASGQTSYAQQPESAVTAQGRVFEDIDKDGRFGAGDAPLKGVRVSNGDQIVETDSDGHYELPLSGESIIFVTKPTGFRTALNRQNLPMFFYIHKPDGSPKLRFPGSSPTGPLPRSIDFPLYRQDEPEQFQVLLFGDPQPRNITEVDYITRDVMTELIDTPAKFGVTLGDIEFASPLAKWRLHPNKLKTRLAWEELFNPTPQSRIP